jgi:hypothetical protein
MTGTGQVGESVVGIGAALTRRLVRRRSGRRRDAVGPPLYTASRPGNNRSGQSATQRCRPIPVLQCRWSISQKADLPFDEFDWLDLGLITLAPSGVISVADAVLRLGQAHSEIVVDG